MIHCNTFKTTFTQLSQNKTKSINYNRQGLDKRRTGNLMTAISAILLQYQVSYCSSFSSSFLNFFQGDQAPRPGLLGLLPAQAFRPESDHSRGMYQVGLIQMSLLSLADHYILHS